EIVVSRRERHPVAFALLTQQGEQQPEESWEVLLNIGSNDAAQRRLSLDGLHPAVISRQRDDCFHTMIAKRRLELAFGMRRVQRRDDSSTFPGAELRDQELGAVGQQQRHAIASTDVELQEGSGARVAQLLELTVRDRRTLEEEGRSIGLLAGGPGDVIKKS